MVPAVFAIRVNILFQNIFHDLKGDTRAENLKGGLKIIFEF